jgi:hypothetical protein
MEMTTNPDSKFKPLIRISQIEDDVAAIVTVWGPLHKDTTHNHFVRGVPVSRTSITEESNGRMYRWCVFPDFRVMLVNEGNIIAKRAVKQ